MRLAQSSTSPVTGLIKLICREVLLLGLRNGVGQFHKPRNPLLIADESSPFNPLVSSESKLPIFLHCIPITIQCQVCQLHNQVDCAMRLHSLFHSCEEVLIFLASYFAAEVSNKAGVC